MSDYLMQTYVLHAVWEVHEVFPCVDMEGIKKKEFVSIGDLNMFL